MNLILLFQEDFAAGSDTRVILSGRRAKHLREIHRADSGDELLVGLANGGIGVGQVISVAADRVELEVRFDSEPPQPLDVTLVLALPRPLVLKRSLIAATSMGVKRIILLNANRVEKSFWQSKALEPEAQREQLVLGLEQARDTRIPEISLCRRFRPFVEDELPRLLEQATGVVAHPDAERGTAPTEVTPGLLAIGPEGGWVDHEMDLLVGAGLRPIGLGERILRVETALAVLLARFA